MAEWIKLPFGMEEGLGPGDFVLDGSQLPSPNRGQSPPPQFSAHVHCGQKAGWIKLALGIEVDLCPCYVVLDWDPAPILKGGGASLFNFRPISIVAKRLDASRCHAVWRYGFSPGEFVLDGDPAPSQMLRVEAENFEIGLEMCSP